MCQSLTSQHKTLRKELSEEVLWVCLEGVQLNGFDYLPLMTLIVFA